MTTESLPEHGYGPEQEEHYTIDGTVYTVHPIARLFPLIEGKDFDELVADVKDRGVRHPVIRRETVIIDGRNRVRAALVCGAKVPFEDLPEFEHPARVILTENIHTRLLTTSQRAALAARIRLMAPGVFTLPTASRRPRAASPDTSGSNGKPAPGQEPEAPKPQEAAADAAAAPAGDAESASPNASASQPSTGSDKPAVAAADAAATARDDPEPTPEPQGPSRREVAASVGVSDEYTRRAERLGEVAPELLDLVSAGDVTIRDAYAICEEPKDVRERAVASLGDGTVKTLVQAVKFIKRLAEAAPELRARVFAGKSPLADAHAICEEPREVRDKAVSMVSRGSARNLAEALRKIKRPAGASAASGQAAGSQSSSGPAPRGPQARSAGKTEQPALPPLPDVGGSASVADGTASSSSPAASGGPTSPPAPAAASGAESRPAPAPASSAGADPASSPGSSGPLPADPVPGSVHAALADVHPDLMTPPVLLSSLRVVFGHIDLDPCSNPDAQDRIAAGDWYSSEQYGTTQNWSGTVWVFPPPQAAATFAGKLYKELLSGAVKTAGFFGPADLTAPWASRLLGLPSFDALLVEVERGPFEIAGGGSRQQLPVPMAVFLFGIDKRDHAVLARSLGVWGRLLVAPTVNKS